jgi:hypothetical protein
MGSMCLFYTSQKKKRGGDDPKRKRVTSVAWGVFRCMEYVMYIHSVVDYDLQDYMGVSRQRIPSRPIDATDHRAHVLAL